MSLAVDVSVRERPAQNQEEASSVAYAVAPCEGGVLLTQEMANERRTYSVREFFPQNSTNDEVLSTLCPEVLRRIEVGVNATVITYGQTGSGKTYTTTALATELVARIFELEPVAVEFSAVQVYMGDTHDLLVNKSNSARVLSHRTGGLPEVPSTSVGSHAECMEKFEIAYTNRETRGHMMNANSSRSHVIYRLVVTLESGREASLCLCDLAGSERLDKTGVTGAAMKEGTFINSSLEALSRCVLALCEDRGHVPFRDSMLTHMLRPTMERAYVHVVCCISSAKASENETRQTLSFADFARRMKLKRVRERYSVSGPSTDDAPAEELLTLRTTVHELRDKIHRQTAKIDQLEQENAALKSDNAFLEAYVHDNVQAGQPRLSTAGEEGDPLSSRPYKDGALSTSATNNWLLHHAREAVDSLQDIRQELMEFTIGAVKRVNDQLEQAKLETAATAPASPLVVGVDVVGEEQGSDTDSDEATLQLQDIVDDLRMGNFQALLGRLQEASVVARDQLRLQEQAARIDLYGAAWRAATAEAASLAAQISETDDLLELQRPEEREVAASERRRRSRAALDASGSSTPSAILMAAEAGEPPVTIPSTEMFLQLEAAQRRVTWLEEQLSRLRLKMLADTDVRRLAPSRLSVAEEGMVNPQGEPVLSQQQQARMHTALQYRDERLRSLGRVYSPPLVRPSGTRNEVQPFDVSQPDERVYGASAADTCRSTIFAAEDSMPTHPSPATLRTLFEEVEARVRTMLGDLADSEFRLLQSLFDEPLPAAACVPAVPLESMEAAVRATLIHAEEAQAALLQHWCDTAEELAGVQSLHGVSSRALARWHAARRYNDERLRSLGVDPNAGDATMQPARARSTGTREASEQPIDLQEFDERNVGAGQQQLGGGSTSIVAEEAVAASNVHPSALPMVVEAEDHARQLLLAHEADGADLLFASFEPAARLLAVARHGVSEEEARARHSIESLAGEHDALLAQMQRYDALSFVPSQAVANTEAVLRHALERDAILELRLSAFESLCCESVPAAMEGSERYTRRLLEEYAEAQFEQLMASAPSPATTSPLDTDDEAEAVVVETRAERADVPAYSSGLSQQQFSQHPTSVPAFDDQQGAQVDLAPLVVVAEARARQQLDDHYASEVALLEVLYDFSMELAEHKLLLKQDRDADARVMHRWHAAQKYREERMRSLGVSPNPWSDERRSRQVEEKPELLEADERDYFSPSHESTTRHNQQRLNTLWAQEESAALGTTGAETLLMVEDLEQELRNELEQNAYAEGCLLAQVCTLQNQPFVLLDVFESNGRREITTQWDVELTLLVQMCPSPDEVASVVTRVERADFVALPATPVSRKEESLTLTRVVQQLTDESTNANIDPKRRRRSAALLKVIEALREQLRLAHHQSRALCVGTIESECQTDATTFGSSAAAEMLTPGVQTQLVSDDSEEGNNLRAMAAVMVAQTSHARDQAFHVRNYLLEADDDVPLELSDDLVAVIEETLLPQAQALRDEAHAAEARQQAVAGTVAALEAEVADLQKRLSEATMASSNQAVQEVHRQAMRAEKGHASELERQLADANRELVDARAETRRLAESIRSSTTGNARTQVAMEMLQSRVNELEARNEDSAAAVHVQVAKNHQLQNRCRNLNQMVCNMKQRERWYMTRLNQVEEEGGGIVAM